MSSCWLGWEVTVTFTLLASLVNSVNPEQHNLVLAFWTISTVLATIQKGPLGIDVGSITIHKPILSTLELSTLMSPWWSIWTLHRLLRLLRIWVKSAQNPNSLCRLCMESEDSPWTLLGLLVNSKSYHFKDQSLSRVWVESKQNLSKVWAFASLHKSNCKQQELNHRPQHYKSHDHQACTLPIEPNGH